MDILISVECKVQKGAEERVYEGCVRYNERTPDRSIYFVKKLIENAQNLSRHKRKN